MAESIVTIGLQLETQALQSGARQAVTTLQGLAQASAQVVQATQTLQQSSTQAAANFRILGAGAASTSGQLPAFARNATQASMATVQLGQASQQALAGLKAMGTGAASSSAQLGAFTINAARASQATQQLGQGATRSATELSQMGRQIAGVVAGYVSFQTAIAGARAIVDATVKTESLTAAFKGITGSSRESGEAMDFIRVQAQRLGVDFLSLAQGYKTIAAAARGTTLEGQASRDIFLAIAEAGRVYQLTAEQIEGATLAVGQMISKGTVQSEELRGQLGERLPGAFQIAARAMGVTTAELGKMLEAGQVLATDFLPKFAAQLRKELGGSVEEASQTAAAALARFGNAVRELATSIGNSGVVNALTAIANELTKIIDRATKAGPALEDFKKRQAGIQELRGGAAVPPETLARATELNRLQAADQADLTNRYRTHVERGIDSVGAESRVREMKVIEDRIALREKELALIRETIVAAKQQGLALSGQEAPGVDMSGFGKTPMPKGLGTVPEQYKEIVRRAAEQYQLDPAVFAALIEQESKFDPKIISRSGAMGLTQLMPGTAKDMGVTQPFDPWQNVYGGAKYLRQQLNTFGDYPTALMAYNAGPGRVRSGEAYGMNEPVNYVKSVQAIAARNRGDLGGPLADVNLKDPAEVRDAAQEAERERKKQAREAEQEQQKAFNRQIAYGDALADADKKVAEQKMRLQDQLQDKIDEASGSEEEAFRRRAEKAGFEGQELETLIALRQKLNNAQADKRGLQMLEKLEEATAELTTTERERFELHLQNMKVTPGMAERLMAGFDAKEAAERSVSTEDEARDAINRFRANPNYSKAAGIDPQMDKAYATGLEMIDRWSDRIADFVAKGKLDFKALADSAIAEFLRISIKSALTTLYNTETVQGWLQWGMKAVQAGTAVAGAGSGGYDAATGMAVGSSAVYPLAEGGPMYAGRPTLIGEKGPELLIPQQSGTVIPNSKLGGQVFHVNFNVTSPDAGSFQRSRAEIQRSLISAMQAAQRSA